MRGGIVAQTAPIEVTEHCTALGAARPIAAGAVVACRERAAVRLRAGQQVVAIGCEADARDHSAVFGQRGLRTELVVVAVQIVDVLRHDLTLEVLPWTGADAIARING